MVHLVINKDENPLNSEQNFEQLKKGLNAKIYTSLSLVRIKIDNDFLQKFLPLVSTYKIHSLSFAYCVIKDKENFCQGLANYLQADNDLMHLSLDSLALTDAQIQILTNILPKSKLENFSVIGNTEISTTSTMKIAEIINTINIDRIQAITDSLIASDDVPLQNNLISIIADYLAISESFNQYMQNTKPTRIYQFTQPGKVAYKMNNVFQQIKQDDEQDIPVGKPTNNTNPYLKG
jgi:hypothetical protein